MLACCITKEKGGALIKASILFMKRRATLNYKSEISEIDLLYHYAALPSLCIDEIGRTKENDDDLTFLSNLIDIRHTDKKPTVLLSNCILKKDCIEYKNNQESCKNCENKICLESKLSMDIISRLREDSIFITIEGRDRRRGN